ncbi:MAG TPA: manganese efflux pump, partial [Sphingomicrobium sp.]|nr:manganese efflux pump [Sphingomicrobium sp.]
KVRRWRIVLTFGLFEFFIPLLGLWLGQRASGFVAGSVDWLGPALLAMLGSWTIYSAFRSQQEAEQLASRVTSWSGLIALSAGLSIDNLIVGFSLGLGEVEPLILAATIAAFSVTFALIGLNLGHCAQENHRRSAEAVTGILLIGLAIALGSGVM